MLMGYGALMLYVLPVTVELGRMGPQVEHQESIGLLIGAGDDFPVPTELLHQLAHEDSVMELLHPLLYEGIASYLPLLLEFWVVSDPSSDGLCSDLGLSGCFGLLPKLSIALKGLESLVSGELFGGSFGHSH